MKDISKFFDYSDNKDLIEKLVHFIKKTDEHFLFHINVVSLAEQFKTDFRELLILFIIGLHKGVFKMDWIYHCQHCGAVANETLTIHSATHDGYCQLCDMNFINTLDDNIEVFFSVHPEIRNISPKHNLAYKNKMLNDIAEYKSFTWKNESTIRGIDIIQNSVYRELMGDEVLLPDQSLEIMKSTILFTDIKGSTQLYTELGDSKAFNIVREHFRILFEIIKNNDGVPVKTIGDAVMGVFTKQSDALKASLIAQETFKEYYKSKSHKIEIKIGIHSGTVIIVTLNGRLDYFGSTVNMAARVQSKSLPNEIAISDSIFNNVENKILIKKYVNKIKREKVLLKGLVGLQNIYHINIFEN